jgi:circadian clock protein KaiB
VCRGDKKMGGEKCPLLYQDRSKNNAMNEIAGFRLYITGMNSDSVKALITIKAIRERYLSGNSYLDIVDTLREPERASADGITNIPTLVKLWPSPMKRVSKEIEDPEQTLNILELQSCSRKMSEMVES